MRLLTRSDFDGLACAVLLKEAGIIDSWKFAHPKDLQDGIIPVTENDCLANVPFVEGCGLWFDHHSSETERNAYKGRFIGDSRPCPSAAHVVYDYYGGENRFGHFREMLKGVDKVDSANLTREEILNPKGWVLLGFVMDPRTGLGRFREFTISNYQLMEKLIDCCRTMHIEEILELPDVKERTELYFEQAEKFAEMVEKYTRVYDDVIVTDLRGVDTIYTGNRFLIYSYYPNCNINVWIVSGRKEIGGCSCAVGHSVLNRTSGVNVGQLMLKYGGGGHKAVGTCQFSEDDMDEKIVNLIKEIQEINNLFWISQRVRSLREDEEMSVRDFADRIDVPYKNYREYEETGDFPISVLFKISNRFDIDYNVLALGKQARVNTYQVIRKGKGLRIDRHDGYRYKDLAFNFEKRIFQPLLVTLLPDDDHTDILSHGGQEFNLVTKGSIKFTIEIGGEQFTEILGEGDSVYFDSTYKHAQYCYGDKESRFLAIIDDK
jgi:nanoRNase/pAp phosphatase (c-di-AMP/oligoRNAs hydrolase)/transcriptional regulator with XRE-family HTH domain